jgi:predicted nucleotidyltransferase
MNEEILAEIVNRIKSSDVKKIILFGSVARGEQDKYSDIDIIIVKETEERFINRLLNIASFSDLPVQVDFFVYTPSEFEQMLKMNNPFIQKVVKEGKLIYEE